MLKPHVLTGGPHSGKTSVIECLKRRGYRTLAESAVLVIEELNQKLGVEGQRAWRTANRAAFQEMIALRQAELEDSIKGARGVWFLDRSLVDVRAFSHLHGHPAPGVLDRLLVDKRYAVPVFLLDLVTPFSSRADTGRTSDEATARRAEQFVERAYAELDYELVRIPLLPIEDRTDLILSHLGLGSRAQ